VKLFIILALLLAFSTEAFAKKDFKGLFGSYRREKFTENEARENAFGVDILLSTLFPIQDVVRSREDTHTSNNSAPLNYSVFFNFEGNVWYSLNYNWVIYGSFGWYNYSARKENALTLNDPTATTTPIFHEFELQAFPVVAGLRYRFLRDDIVPYISAGAGMAFTTRKGSYDNDPSGTYTHTVKENVLAAQASIGLEFYFSPNAGLRIEASGYYMNITAREMTTGGVIAQQPDFLAQAHPVSIRYASGIFITF
jgi:hypothetical protein